MSLPKLLFVTSQFRDNSTGPGTFVQYIKEADSNGKIDVEFISDEEPDANFLGRVTSFPLASKLRKRVKGGWLVGLLLYAILANLRSYSNRDVIWYVDPIYAFFFLFFRKFRRHSVVMVNDVNNMNWHDAFKRGTIGWLRAFSGFLRRRIEVSSLRRCNCIVANSKFTKAAIIENYGIPENRIQVLYKAVDLSQFCFRARSPIGETFIILFVKSDWRRGGLANIVRAAEVWGRNAEIRFVGGDEEDLKALRRDLGKDWAETVTVRALGRKGRAEMPSIYQDANVVALLSSSEALGVSLLEAISSGVPVVASNVGGIPEVLAYGEAGFLVNPDDTEGVARIFERIFCSDPKVVEYISFGRQHARNFDVATMVSGIIAISNNLMDEQSN
jgi:glycosyltransferase involved in cell wall biosynthesis